MWVFMTMIDRFKGGAVRSIHDSILILLVVWCGLCIAVGCRRLVDLGPES